MIAHTTLPVSNYLKSKAFYIQALAPLGYTNNMEEGDAAAREALANEIAAMEDDRRRLPWQDGLPATLAASLEPHRERLEATYDPVANAFELGRNRRRGRLTVTAE